MKKRYIFNIICFNNIFFLYSFFGKSGILDMYYVCNPIIQIILYKIQYGFFNKHNKVIDKMNTKYNKQVLLNYVREMMEEEEDDDDDDDESIAILDENLELSLLGYETNNNEQKFDSIEIN